MPYKHGIYVSELDTSILPPITAESAIPFVVGTAPVGMTDATNVNKAVYCANYAEAVAAFGYVPPKLDSTSGLKKYEYSISEFIYSQFVLFGTGPVVIVNVLDPSTHKAAITSATVTLSDTVRSVTLSETGVIPSTVVVTVSSAAVESSKYTVTFDDDGYAIVTVTDTSVTGAATITGYKTDPTAVDGDDIIGGTTSAGVKSGLVLIEDVFPKYRVTPGIIACPGFSHNAEVAAVMAAKCESINGLFNCVCIVDVNTSTCTQYTQVSSWKTTNNITDKNQIVCWPSIALDGTFFHMSTQLCGLLGQVDGDNDQIPYVSPSNKNLQMTASVLGNGTEVWLALESANTLNGQGIVTVLNWTSGWVAWGNRTACYPSTSDPKDAFIPIRRMFTWIGNTLVTTFWNRVDYPLNRRQVETIVDSVNIWLNGLTAKQCILGGRIEFLESENTTTDLMDGIATFHVYITPPSPNREINFQLQYDTDYLEALFG